VPVLRQNSITHLCIHLFRDVALFLPFRCSKKGGKRRQAAAQSEGEKSMDSSRDEASSGLIQQTAAKSG
jgi:hypothetical protein